MTKESLEQKFNALKEENIKLAQGVAQAQVQIAQNEGKMQLLQEMYAATEKDSTDAPDATPQGDGGDRDNADQG